MIRGTVNQYGIVTLVWDASMENLPAPPLEGNVEAKYLPCNECGCLQVVPVNTVSITCGECWEKGPVTGQCEECGKDVFGEAVWCEDCFSGNSLMARAARGIKRSDLEERHDRS